MRSLVFSLFQFNIFLLVQIYLYITFLSGGNFEKHRKMALPESLRKPERSDHPRRL